MPLKTSKELTDETVSLIAKFKSGELKPIPTGIDHLDEALLGGLLPGSVLGIVGRSGHGKSYDMERIQRKILNDEPDVVYMNANWELSHFKLLVRDISFRTKQSVKTVLFAPLDEDSSRQLKEVCDIHRTENVYYQNEPVTSDVFEDDVLNLITKFPNAKIVVAIDNLENILIDKGSQKECMDKLLYKLNILKNKHFFISFIVLNQMNREYVYDISDIKKHKPHEGHIYGSDQFYKLCDVVYIKLIPSKLGIRDKFMIFGKNQYPWLDEHKDNESLKTSSFDPFGRAFYFYVKQRQPEDEKNIKDIFIEIMYTKEESIKTELPKAEINTSMPIFDEEETPSEIVKYATLTDAFGPPGSPTEQQDDDDRPF